MASKFQHRRCVPSSRPTSQFFLLSVLIFISASSAEINSEARQCHWCGPLAEQVHRSRRAPSCGEPGSHVTVCEDDDQYCATVASAPPLKISRYCVKLYQDECYPLYCNTTNTWKMTCPCRGDLCNDATTEREKEAFAALAKLVAKTHSGRKKRFVQEDHDPTHIVNNDTALQDKPLDMGSNTVIKTDVHKPMGTNNTDIKTDIHKQDESKDQSVNIVSSTVDKINKVNNEKSIEDNKIDGMHDVSQTVIVTIPTTMKVEVRQSVSNIKPTDQMPPAESLQQNATPKTIEEQVTDTTTTTEIPTATTSITSITNATLAPATTLTTDKPPIMKKNYGVSHKSNLVMFVINFFVFIIL